MKNQQKDKIKTLYLSGELHFKKVELCPGVRTYSPQQKVPRTDRELRKGILTKTHTETAQKTQKELRL